MRKRTEPQEKPLPQPDRESCAQEVRRAVLENGGTLCPTLEMALLRLEQNT